MNKIDELSRVVKDEFTPPFEYDPHIRLIFDDNDEDIAYINNDELGELTALLLNKHFEENK